MSDAKSGSPLVLVTGGTGFVGSRLALRLIATGFRVRAIVRAKGTAPELQDPGIEEIEGDFARPEVAGPAAKGADAVVHCAATSGPDLEPVRQVNVEGTRAMIGASLAAGVRRYVHISTISVYARVPEERLDEASPLKEEGEPYGWTKADADRIVFEGMRRGLPATILRPGAILGVHRTSTWGVKMPARIRDQQIKLRGDGREILPWVHVENLVDAVLLSLENDQGVGRAYNVADKDVSWRDYTDEVRGWFGTLPLESIPLSEFGDYWMGRFEASRIRSELAYEPRRSYAEGMAEAAEYWAREGAGQT